MLEWVFIMPPEKHTKHSLMNADNWSNDIIINDTHENSGQVYDKCNLLSCKVFYNLIQFSLLGIISLGIIRKQK